MFRSTGLRCKWCVICPFTVGYWGTHTFPATDPTFTTIPRPCSAMCGMTSCASLIGAKVFVSNAFRVVSRSTSRIGPVQKMSLHSLSLSQTGLPGHITPALLTSTSIRPDSLSTLLTTLLRLSSSVTSKTICQKRSQCQSFVRSFRLERNHPFDFFVRKPIHRFASACRRVDLAPRGSKCLASSGLRQPVVFHVRIRRHTVQIRFHLSNNR